MNFSSTISLESKLCKFVISQYIFNNIGFYREVERFMISITFLNKMVNNIGFQRLGLETEQTWYN